MLSLGYFVIIAIASFTLGAETTRQFSKPLTVIKHERYPILQRVELSSLSSASEYLRGYIVYIVVFQLIFFGILLSTELFDLLHAAIPDGGRTVGATGALPFFDNINSSLSPEYAKPLIISSILIFGLSTPLFGNIEKFFRRLSHKIAGIPRGIYRVLRNLNQIDYKKLMRRQSLPLNDALDQSTESANLDEFDQGLIDEIKSDLTIVEAFRPSVFGVVGDAIFSQEKIDSIYPLIKNQSKKYDEIKTEIDNFKPRANSRDTLEELKANASHMKYDLQALFSVAYLRNIDSNFETDHLPTAKIIEHLKDDEKNPAFNSLAGSLIVGFIFSLVSYFLIDYFFDGLIHSRERDIFSSVSDALWFSSYMAILFGITGLISLFVREGQFELNRWPDFDFNNIPFGRYFVYSLFPLLIGLLFIMSFKFIEFSLDVSTKNGIFNLNHTAVFFKTFSSYTIGMILPLFSVCWFVFFVTDTHDRTKARTTVAIGSVFALIFSLLMTVVIFVFYQDASGAAERVELSFQFLVAAVLFFSTFCGFLELSEKRNG